MTLTSSLTVLLLLALKCSGFHLPLNSISSKISKLKQIRYRCSSPHAMCTVNNQKKQAASKKSILGSKLNSKAAIQAVKTTTLPTGRKSVTAKPIPIKTTVKEVKVAKIISASDSISISSSSKSVSNLPLLDEVGDTGGNLESLVVDENFRTALKDFRKANAPKKLVRAVADHSESGMLDQNMTVHAFRTLQRMNRASIHLLTFFSGRNDLCADLIPFWHLAVDRLVDGKVDIEPTVSLIRSCCKLQRLDLAEGIALRAGVNLDRLDNLIRANNSSTGEQLSPHSLSAHSRMLPELSLGYASIGSYPKALAALGMMHKYSIKIEIEMSKQILKMFLRETSPEDVRRCLRALLLINGLADNDSIQLLTSTYMKSIEFVKGAVSMETLPPAECAEAAFIGRSNVGKSSLINMISNRKGIAFVSKTPGKTSEFNYFDAKGRVGMKNEKHRFYLVDLPGVGYAEVRKELRASWLVLLRDYVVNRETLRIVFHLIDSRHGILDTDEDCLSLLEVLPEHVQYVIVLTKVDKHNTGVRRDVLERIANVVKQRTDRQVPIVYTSSETREGGSEIWSVLLDAVAGDSSNDFYSKEII